ncbi:phage integrase N-terminal SAM-like domain-containing protein [Chloroflexi bacterium TSY]|nr:phage integrase N-terminal SAM-like domain-containing protein [Chloroflexi bacterium TSY]MBV7330282.1 phage integrase N-terminal SAM-like domain-containing protein [Chloroflexi bacterium TSY]
MNQEFSAAVTGFCAHVRMLSPQSETVKHYESDLNQFGQVIEKRPREIGRQEITTFVTAQLEAGMSSATVNRRVATLSRFSTTWRMRQKTKAGQTRWCGVYTDWIQVAIFPEI